MTKQELIKGILELGENLKDAEGMGALVEINEMELLVDKFLETTKPVNVDLADVSKCSCGFQNCDNWENVIITCKDCKEPIK
jgi:hypothetical protein